MTKLIQQQQQQQQPPPPSKKAPSPQAPVPLPAQAQPTIQPLVPPNQKQLLLSGLQPQQCRAAALQQKQLLIQEIQELNKLRQQLQLQILQQQPQRNNVKNNNTMVNTPAIITDRNNVSINDSELDLDDGESLSLADNPLGHLNNYGTKAVEDVSISIEDDLFSKSAINTISPVSGEMTRTHKIKFFSHIFVFGLLNIIYGITFGNY